jgi:hypothetical protein
VTSRGGRALGAVALLACLLAPVATGSAGASPRAAASACSGAGGVTVVVDFQSLKNSDGSSPPSLIGCAVGSPSSGFDALTKAGIEVQQVTTNPGFLCRIQGLPASKSYANNCATIPPTSAYWGYWVATRGGGWCYSQIGAGARTPVPGTVEGWSFSSGTVEGGTPPRPAVPPHVTGAPTRITDGSCPSPPATTTTTIRPTTTAPPAPPAEPGGTGGTGATTPTTRRPGGTTTTATAAAGGDVVPVPADTSTSSDTSSTTTTAPRGTVGVRLADDHDSGSPVGAALGGAAVVALAAAGLLTARRRGRGNGEDTI